MELERLLELAGVPVTEGGRKGNPKVKKWEVELQFGPDDKDFMKKMVVASSEAAAIKKAETWFKREHQGDGAHANFAVPVKESVITEGKKFKSEGEMLRWLVGKLKKIQADNFHPDVEVEDVLGDIDDVLNTIKDASVRG